MARGARRFFLDESMSGLSRLSISVADLLAEKFTDHLIRASSCLACSRHNPE